MPGLCWVSFQHPLIRHIPRQQGSWGQHGAHLGPAGPRWVPCWPHEFCPLGCKISWSIKAARLVVWIIDALWNLSGASTFYVGKLFEEIVAVCRRCGAVQITRYVYTTVPYFNITFHTISQRNSFLSFEEIWSSRTAKIAQSNKNY